MSNLADRTERKALQILACTLRYFEKLHHLDMSKEDDFDACAAGNLIQGIIESNGYLIKSDYSNRTVLKKNVH